jgi:hypothetical protein
MSRPVLRHLHELLQPHYVTKQERFKLTAAGPWLTRE